MKEKITKCIEERGKCSEIEFRLENYCQYLKKCILAHGYARKCEIYYKYNFQDHCIIVLIHTYKTERIHYTEIEKYVQKRLEYILHDNHISVKIISLKNYSGWFCIIRKKIHHYKSKKSYCF